MTFPIEHRERLLAELDDARTRIRSLYRELDRANRAMTEMRVGIEAVAQAIEEDGEEWELAETLREIAR
jgi:uncharacterized protein (DUF3084 family)